MKLSELQPRQGGVNVKVEVTDIGPVREFQKFGEPGRVVTAIVKDDSGEMVLTLWNEQIDQVAKGDTIEIENGYVNEWQGEKQLTPGRKGTIKKV
jgi:replication factor A1